LGSPLLHQVRRTIERHALLPAGSRVVVGLSGGSDSVALACLLLDLSGPGGFAVAGLAHTNHQLRPTADRDEAFCRDLAARLGQPFVTETMDVRGHADSRKLTIEDAARRLRYDVLARAAARLDADRIAVGHTEDDQAETLLLKLVRGAGPTGLAGIYPRRGRVVRPLLEVSRADLRRHLEQIGRSWVEDETNQDLENPRNRIRHVVLPELERSYGGTVRAALARAADILREDARMLDELAEGRFSALVTATAGGLTVDAAGLAAEPGPIVRRVLLKALREVSGGREVERAHVRGAADVLAGACGGIDVPGGRVELRRGILVFTRRGAGQGDILDEP